MLKVTNITIKNFLSVGNVTQAVTLDGNGLTLVLGANTDANGGITRNGAGKSTILQAISFALYGKPLTRIKIPNLVNNINNKGMLVTIEMERAGIKYRIERGKKPDVMKFYCEGEERVVLDETQGENRQTQAEIDRIVGMSHTMFKHIVALNTFTDPFLKMSVADQRIVIEELLGITQISERAEVLKKLIQQTKELIRDCESQIKATNEANDRIQAAIRMAEAKLASWQVDHERNLAEMAESLNVVEDIDFDAELAKFDLIDQATEARRTLDQQISDAERKRRDMQAQADRHVADATRLRAQAENGIESQLRRLRAEAERAEKAGDRHRAQLVSFITERDKLREQGDSSETSVCVCCGQDIQGTDHLATILASIETQIGELQTRIDSEEQEILARAAEHNHIMDEIEKLTAEHVQRRTTLLDEANQCDAWSTDALRNVEELKAEIVRLQADRDGVELPEQSIFQNRDELYQTRQQREVITQALEREKAQVNPFISQVEDLKQAIQVIDYTGLNDATELLKHQDFLAQLLTNKNSFIRKKIIDQNLSYLNSRLNHYLEKLGLPHEVVFQSDLSVDISLLGRDFDFEQLSRGEMNRVIMATSWSFRDVWESTNQSCNLLWVDELLDQGTDGQGVEAALSILKSMARDRGKNVFLISHRDELQSRIDRTLLVRKDNGFTTFEADNF